LSTPVLAELLQPRPVEGYRQGRRWPAIEHMVELEIPEVTVEQVAAVVAAAVPNRFQPEHVVSISPALDGGVRVAADEPLSQLQRTALAAVRDRWPSI
jgi:hypothetical protein